VGGWWIVDDGLPRADACCRWVKVTSVSDGHAKVSADSLSVNHPLPVCAPHCLAVSQSSLSLPPFSHPEMADNHDSVSGKMYSEKLHTAQQTCGLI